MRTLVLAAVTAAFVVAPSDAYADPSAPPRMTASCTGVFRAINNDHGVEVAGAVATAGALATQISCSVHRAGYSYGGTATEFMPSPAAVVTSTVWVPWHPDIEVCVFARAWFADGTQESIGPVCRPAF